MNNEYKAQHENLVLQIILNAINEDGADYLNTESGQNWLGLLGITTEVAEEAL